MPDSWPAIRAIRRAITRARYVRHPEDTLIGRMHPAAAEDYALNFTASPWHLDPEEYAAFMASMEAFKEGHESVKVYGMQVWADETLPYDEPVVECGWFTSMPVGQVPHVAVGGDHPLRWADSHAALPVYGVAGITWVDWVDEGELGVRWEQKHTAPEGVPWLVLAPNTFYVRCTWTPPETTARR